MKFKVVSLVLATAIMLALASASADPPDDRHGNTQGKGHENHQGNGYGHHKNDVSPS
jgi:hypothetical protein